MRHSTAPHALAGSLLLALAACTTTTVNDGGHGGGPASDGGGGTPSGPTTIASLIQVAPARMFSDGTNLFWSNDSGNTPIFSMPVTGGAISMVVPTSGGWLVGVDDTSVYYSDEAGALYRSAKGGGGSATLISEPGALARGATISGGRAYWYEIPSPSGPPSTPVTVNSAALQGGAVSTVATFSTSLLAGQQGLGVTATTVFFSGIGFQQQLAFFPLGSGVPDGGMPATVSGVAGCEDLYSDTDAVYCLNGNVERITSDGTVSTLGMILSNTERGGVLAEDDSYVYWVDSVTVGTIMRGPKTGGTAAIIARDTVPIAIAVDSHAIYWSDDGGNIMRLAK